MGGSASTLNLADIKFTENECKHAIKELFQAKTFEALADADNTVSLGALHEQLKEKTDCFLTHDWGTDLGMDNHARVSRVNDALKKRGLKTWFDGEKMEGNVKKKMISGIDHTYCVVVFVTRRYMDKVNSDNAEDNCQLEFNNACRRQTGKKMVPVVMEARMQATNDWIGEVGMVLGGSLYVNLSAEDSFEVRMDELYSRILGVTGTTIQKVMDSPVWGELISQKAQSAPAAPVAHVEPTTPAAAVSDSGHLVAELKAWIVEHTTIVSKFANKYALQLVDFGVGSVDKLRKKLIRNANFLGDMSFDEDDAEELMIAVLGRREAPKPTDKPAEREFKDLFEAYMSARTLGNAGKEVLEEAMGSSDYERAMVAKMLLALAYHGGGTFTADKTKSKAYAEDVLPWMHQHALPPTDDAVAPSDVDQKPYALSTIVTAVLAFMIRDGISCIKDEAKAVLYMKAAVPHGISKAQFLLGYATKMGKGTPANKEQGVQYYRLAAAQGYPMAIVNLGVSYYNGEGVQKDLVESCRFFRMIADKGHSRGLYELGTMYYNGEGVSKDHYQAARLFQQSHDKGYNDGTYFLAVCYFYGHGVGKDLSKAKELATKAASRESSYAKELLTKM